MPINYHYIKLNDKYAQCYRLQELLRKDFNAGNLTVDEHQKLEDIIISDLLKWRKQIKDNNLINASLSDVTLSLTP